MRLFIAALPDSTIVREVGKFRELQEKDLETTSGLRWTTDEKLHVTICFIGDVLEESVGNICSVIELDSKKLRTFHLSFYDYQLQPTERKARMLWARFLQSEAFLKTTGIFQKRFTELGWGSSRKEQSKAHMTLARFPMTDHTLNISKPADLSFPDLWVNELILFNSDPEADESSYQELARFPLKS